MSYDTKCHELAQFFLSDVMPPSDRAARLADELARQIQDVIEGFFVVNAEHTASRDCWCKPTVERP